MDKFNKLQMLKLSIIAALLVIAPLLSPSLRPTYIYFVVNLLIIAVGAEAGLLSFFSKETDDKKHTSIVSPKPMAAPDQVSPVKEETANSTTFSTENCPSEKIVGVVKVLNKVKKCPSTPSLFFIGSGEKEAEELVEYDDDEEEVEGLNGQELFHKAEIFIGNFYKQLKMQREDSWKKIHGLYHKAF